MMSTPINILWIVLSVMVAGLCGFSFLQPHWFVEPNSLDSFGVYKYCTQSPVIWLSYKTCQYYGGSFNFAHLPSHAWKCACVLYGGGCIVLLCAAGIALLSLCVPRVRNQSVPVLCGYLQCGAVLLLVAGLVVFPVGLDAPFVKNCCGSSSFYNSGDCQIGWAYVLGIMGSGLAMFCPYISQFTDMKVQEVSPPSLV